MQLNIRVQYDDFNLQAEHQALLTTTANIGAIVSFIGLVREYDHTTHLSHLFLEHYPNVTEAEIFRIANVAAKRWSLQACTIIHRVGQLAAKEQIVLVLTASAHRQVAFEAASFLMDYLKTEAPFWKKEIFVDGREQWVDAKKSDQYAAKKWQISS